MGVGKGGMDVIPVVDIFAGAGGLGEGFASFGRGGFPRFDVRLSIEMDSSACQTLRLRTFFHHASGKSLDDYYRFIDGSITADELFQLHPDLNEVAHSRVWQQDLGGEGFSEDELDCRIRNAIGGAKDWVLIGGPPCQAYSSAGRARNSGRKDYDAANDRRHFLYKEYLRIIARHWPAVFVMENVPGLLSSTAGGGERIFKKIHEDLHDPLAVDDFVRRGSGGDRRYHYRIRPLDPDAPEVGDICGREYRKPSDFIVCSERYGVPQSRQRVLLVGIRDDVSSERPTLPSPSGERVSVRVAVSGLPRLRSGVTRTRSGSDERNPREAGDAWKNALISAPKTRWFKELQGLKQGHVAREISRILNGIRPPQKARGGERVKPRGNSIDYSYMEEHCPDLHRFIADHRLETICNSWTRAHMEQDLHRYLFVAAFGRVNKVSPKLRDFPASLLPNHGNVDRALSHSHFADRFRVQLENEPSTTVVSHLSRDGHYFIHYDPSQCRSMTVREVARLQTFPDNYFFCGNRGEQYRQVGNAVPPYLAVQVAGTVSQIMAESDRAYAVGVRGKKLRASEGDVAVV